MVNSTRGGEPVLCWSDPGNIHTNLASDRTLVPQVRSSDGNVKKSYCVGELLPIASTYNVTSGTIPIQKMKSKALLTIYKYNIIDASSLPKTLILMRDSFALVRLIFANAGGDIPSITFHATVLISRLGVVRAHVARVFINGFLATHRQTGLPGPGPVEKRHVFLHDLFHFTRCKCRIVGARWAIRERITPRADFILTVVAICNFSFIH